MSTNMVDDLRSTLAEELEALSLELMQRLHAASTEGQAVSVSGARRIQLQDRIRFLGTLLAGLHAVDPAHVERESAGLGSTVRVRDVESGEPSIYVLVPFELVDGTAGKVTLASPIGQALLGQSAGSVVEIATPTRARRVRVDEVTTIWDALDGWRNEQAGRRIA